MVEPTGPFEDDPNVTNKKFPGNVTRSYRTRDPLRVVGEVRGRPCLIVDDIIATGTTLARAVDALNGAGARPEFTIAATHGLLLSGAREKLGHESIREVFVTDTV